MLKIIFVTRTWHVDGDGWGNFNFPFKCTSLIIQGSFTYLTIFAGLGILSLDGRHQDPACDLYVPSLPAAATMLAHSTALLLLLAAAPAHRYPDTGNMLLCRYLDHGVIYQPPSNSWPLPLQRDPVWRWLNALNVQHFQIYNGMGNILTRTKML